MTFETNEFYIRWARERLEEAYSLTQTKHMPTSELTEVSFQEMLDEIQASLKRGDHITLRPTMITPPWVVYDYEQALQWWICSHAVGPRYA